MASGLSPRKSDDKIEEEEDDEFKVFSSLAEYVFSIPEMFEEIYKFVVPNNRAVRYRDLCRASQVCRAWRDHLARPSTQCRLWHAAVADGTELSPLWLQPGTVFIAPPVSHRMHGFQIPNALAVRAAAICGALGEIPRIRCAAMLYVLQKRHAQSLVPQLSHQQYTGKIGTFLRNAPDTVDAALLHIAAHPVVAEFLFREGVTVAEELLRRVRIYQHARNALGPVSVNQQ